MTSGGYGRVCVWEEGWATVSRVDSSSYCLPAVVDDAQQAVLSEVRYFGIVECRTRM